MDLDIEYWCIYRYSVGPTLGECNTPWEAATEYFKRPIIERDDAAELRAAAKRYLARLDECEENRYPPGSIARLEKDAALQALRTALATTEEES